MRVKHLLAVVPFVLGIGSIAAEAAVLEAWLALLNPNFHASCETAERVLEKLKLYIAVLVSLMRRRASSIVVLLP